MNPDRVARAEELFRQGYNCAQAVVHAFQPELDIDSATALRCACGFGGGLGRCQEVCGAITGGVIVLGLRHGRALGETKAKTDDTYARVRLLVGRFEQAHGSCRCRDLLDGCNLQTAEGQREFREKSYHHLRCTPFVREVVALVDEIMGPESAPT